MKKVLIGFLALIAAAGAFAQEISVSGSVQMDMGINTQIYPEDYRYLHPDYNPLKNKDDYTTYSEWYWDILDNGGTYLQVNAETDSVKAWLRTRASVGGGRMTWMGDVTANFGMLDLSFGYNRLPFAYWSSWELYADNHLGFGASSTDRSTYLQIKLIDSLIIGIAEGNVLSEMHVKKAWSPYFYITYTFLQEDMFELGAGFIGAHLSGSVINQLTSTSQNDAEFPFMGKLYFTFLGLDPLSFGVNLALYGKPRNSIFSISGNPVIGGLNDDLALEALLNFNAALDVCTIGFAAGFVANLSGEDDNKVDDGGIGLKFGLSAIFDLGGTGLQLIPGVGFTTYNLTHKVNTIETKAKWASMDIGVTFMYSF